MSTNLQLDVPEREILPKDKLADKNLICELRKTCSVLYGLFTEVVRQYYLNGEGYLLGTPKVKWDDDPQKTGIWIDSELNWNDEHPEFRPAIFVSLGDLQSSSPTNPNTPVQMNLRDAIYHYARSVQGTVTFVHVAQRAGEALALCDNTATYLTHFSAQIRDDFCFTTFAEIGRKPLIQANPESSERYMSSVSYLYKFGEQWSSKLESPILKVLNIRASANPADFGLHNNGGHGSIDTDIKPSL